MIEFNTLEEMEPYRNGEDYLFINEEKMLKEQMKLDNPFCSDLRGSLLDIKIKFYMKAKVNIYAKKIEAQNLDVLDIYAEDINARSVFARNISSVGWLRVHRIYAESITASKIYGWWIEAKKDINFKKICIAEQRIKCFSIEGEYMGGLYYCLSGKAEIKGNISSYQFEEMSEQIKPREDQQ